MDTGAVVATIAVFLLFAAAMVAAAFLDRRRVREIEHDASRLPPELRRRIESRRRVATDEKEKA
jgi:hypothetical protein